MLIHELNHVKWDVIGLAETHWTGVAELTYKDSSGKLTEHRSGFRSRTITHKNSTAKSVELQTSK